MSSTGSSVLDQIAAVIGEQEALALSARYRGLYIYVKKTYDDDDEMTGVIGAEAAQKLASYFGGARWAIPVKPGIRWGVLRLAAHGTLSRYEIADTLRVSERTVYRILAEPRDSRQGDLFAASDAA